MFDSREVRVNLAPSTSWKAVRAHLHFARGRPEERLTFDVQPEIANRMGYHDRPRRDGDNTPAVERFMRRYFLIAKEVGTLTRAFSAKLEAEHLKQEPRGLLRFLPARGRKPAPVEPGFVQEGGRLGVVGPEVFDADPVNLLRLFRIADAHDLDLHPDAFTAATRRLGLITSRIRRDPAAARVFLDILTGKKPRRTLELMNEAGVLGRYIPEFGRIVAQMQFNMCLPTPSMSTLCGRWGSSTTHRRPPHGRSGVAAFRRRHHADRGPRGPVPWPCCCTTSARAGGGQEVAGARGARSACERLGLSRPRIDLIAWLVEHHLQMSDYAQKRDVADPATVAAFARLVESPERLRMLLVLTVADIRAVGPGVWNGWKGQLLRAVQRRGSDLPRRPAIGRRRPCAPAPGGARL